MQVDLFTSTTPSHTHKTKYSKWTVVNSATMYLGFNVQLLLDSTIIGLNNLANFIVFQFHWTCHMTNTTLWTLSSIERLIVTIHGTYLI